MWKSFETEKRKELEKTFKKEFAEPKPAETLRNDSFQAGRCHVSDNSTDHERVMHPDSKVVIYRWTTARFIMSYDWPLSKQGFPHRAAGWKELRSMRIIWTRLYMYGL